MRNAAILFLPISLGSATAASSQAPYRAPYVNAAPAVAPDLNAALADWRRLSRGGGYSFADYARFVIMNPGWPGERTMRRSAERLMRQGEAPGTVLAFFHNRTPETGNGYARLAEALAASGRAAEAAAAARSAWRSDDLPLSDEPQIFARFGSSFTTVDNERRADALLFDKKPLEAQRFLATVGPARRAAFAARIALQTRSPDAETLFQAAASQLTTDAGLLMDRLRYLRDANAEGSARALAARPHQFVHRPADVDRFYEMLLLLAGSASEKGEWANAYNIARQIDDALPPGTDMASQPLGVRDKYTSLAWMAGSLAFSALRRPADAVAMFERYGRGGKSAQVITKGLYWAGRASIAAGRLGDASGYFQRAAAFPELFYGQLALERIGREVPRPNPLPTFAVAPAQRAEFARRRLVQATRLLTYYGRSDEQSLFVQALADSVENDAERALAIELGQQLGRQDVPVWVARNARTKGAAFYVQPAYPTLAARVPGGEIWSLTHGIARQESSFDRNAVSHAGARGLMQLMPGTAQEQAGKIGYGYDFSRLTSDPAYNVLLGSTYFQRLLNMWGGNVPLAVASYNAGAGNVRKWVARNGDPRQPGVDVLTWIERIPFSETRGYVQRVIENSVVYDQLQPGGTTRSALHVSRYLGKSRPA